MTDSTQSIVEIAASSDDFNILVQALTTAGLVDTLNAADDITVFAPTDAAFVQLAVDLGYDGDTADETAVFNFIAGALAGLAEDGDPIPLLADILTYHVSPGAKTEADVFTTGTIGTLLDGATFSAENGALVDNEPDIADPTIVTPDLHATNGTIQVIDRVLLPLDIPGNEPSILDIATSSDDFSILVQALTAASLVDKIANADNVTVFAPTNAAFAQLATDLGYTGDTSDADAVFSFIAGALAGLDPNGDPIPLLTDILTYHVSPGAKTAAQVNASEQITTLLTDATFKAQDGELVDAELDIANPTIVGADVAASNGTVQVIDRVLLPVDIPGNTPSILEIATGSDDFSILVQALTAAGLVDTIANAEDVTVFAPTNAAFAQLATDLGFTGDTTDGDAVFAFIADALAGLDENGDPIPLLTDILTYHVSPGAKSAAEIGAAGPISTLLSGANVVGAGTELIDGEPDILNPELVGADVPASNGVIQVLDRVLLPIDIPGNTRSIVKTVVDAGVYSILVQALEVAGLTETLVNAEDITLFAPTDGAFGELAVELGYEGELGDTDAIFGFLVEALTALSADGDPVPLLTDILTYHVSPGAKTLAEIAASDSVGTLLEGATLTPFGTATVDLIDGEPDLFNARISSSDIEASNGTIQSLSRVLVPIDIPGLTRSSPNADEFDLSDGDQTLIGSTGDFAGDTLLNFAVGDLVRFEDGALLTAASVDSARALLSFEENAVAGTLTLEGDFTGSSFVLTTVNSFVSRLTVDDSAVVEGAGGIRTTVVSDQGDSVIFTDGASASYYGEEIASQVYRLYQAALDRAPDNAGQAGWAADLYSGDISLVEIADRFIRSQEFTSRFGEDLTDAAFVDLLYLNVLNRPADAAGAQGWLDFLAGGASRAEVLVGFSQSAEFIVDTQAAFTSFDAQSTSADFTDDLFRLYEATLGRTPESEGLLGWADLLSTGTLDLTDVAIGFVDSAEFQKIYGAHISNAAFVDLLYQNVLGRPGDDAGAAAWQAVLDGGGSRAEVVLGFTQSAEFVAESAPRVKEWIQNPFSEGIDDTILVGGGDNLIAGGSLADVFIFDAAAPSTTVVADLEAWDFIDLESFGFADTTAARAAFSQVEEDTVFEAQGTTITFADVALSDIADDAILV